MMRTKTIINRYIMYVVIFGCTDLRFADFQLQLLSEFVTRSKHLLNFASIRLYCNQLKLVSKKSIENI